MTTSRVTTTRIETWVWVLVYAGLAILAVGLAVQRSDPVLGWTIAIAGALLIAAGALLIWIRSRMTPDKPPSTAP